MHLEGISALFGRGLPVRLLTNGLQGLLFSILWKRFEDGCVHLTLFMIYTFYTLATLLVFCLCPSWPNTFPFAAVSMCIPFAILSWCVGRRASTGRCSTASMKNDQVLDFIKRPILTPNRISNSGTAGWAIAISLVGALYAGALIRAVLSLGSVQAAIRRMMGRGERGAVRLEED